jgi:hypothetical protein
MKKNDITYEYRVFTHRPIDVESMEVGRCTSKVVKELKEKDKVDGRFFHTSDTDEWFFCWNGELQKLNLKGDADVNAALEEVNRLIAEANVAVEEAKKTASEAKDAADAAKDAADNATAAVESIDKLEEAVASKADKGDVEEVANAVKTKQDAISDLSEIRTNANLAKTALQEVPAEYVTETELAGMNYATTAHVNAKQDIISDLETIRSGATAGATALQSIPEEYITETELNDKGFATTEYVGQQIEKIVIPEVVSAFTNDAEYLNKSEADKLYAPIGSASDGSGSYATQDFVREEIEKINISGKQDIISDLETIRSGATAGATALQTIPDEYITETELADKKFATIVQVNAKQDTIEDLETIRTNAELAKTALQSVPDEYITETELADKKFATIDQVNAKQDAISDLEAIRSGAAAGATALQSGDLEGYLKADSDVIKEINKNIEEINTLLGDATALTNTILNA